MSSRKLRSGMFAGLLIACVGFTFGCAKPEPEDTATTPATTTQSDASPGVEKAREAASISLEIEKSPDRASVILEAHGMTQEAFEELLYTIAQDAALTEAYQAARS